jgi:GNAT superfamily N-acetyltransferase
MGGKLGFTLRAVLPGDAERFAALSLRCPDGGRIPALVHYHIDALAALAALRGETAGLVAVASGSEELAASAFVSFGRCQFENRPCQYALFHTLMVDPRYRGNGLGTAITAQCVDEARRRLGGDGVIVALVQARNAASARIAKSLSRSGGLLQARATGVRRRPPAPRGRLSVRAAASDELGAIAEQMNAFYRAHQLYSPETADSLAAWLRASPFDAPFRHAYVGSPSTAT